MRLQYHFNDKPWGRTIFSRKNHPKTKFLTFFGKKNIFRIFGPTLTVNSEAAPYSAKKTPKNNNFAAFREKTYFSIIICMHQVSLSFIYVKSTADCAVVYKNRCYYPLLVSVVRLAYIVKSHSIYRTASCTFRTCTEKCCYVSLELFSTFFTI